MLAELMKNLTTINCCRLKVGYSSVVVMIFYCILLSLALSTDLTALFVDGSFVFDQTQASGMQLLGHKDSQLPSDLELNNMTTPKVVDRSMSAPITTSRIKGTLSEDKPIGSNESITETTIITTTMRSTSTRSFSQDIDDESSIDGPCHLIKVTRRSSVKPLFGSEVDERAFKCSRLGNNNFDKMTKLIDKKRNQLSIQQVEITNSDPVVVYKAINLILGQLNCSKLTVFNISRQQIHNYTLLSNWISSMPQLETIDLTNTSITDIQSIITMDVEPSIELQNLTTLILDNNNITELNFNFIMNRMPNLRHLSLVNNSIFDINCEQKFRPRLSNQFVSISLAGNAINCDRNQLWFTKQFQNVVTNLRFPDHDQINCSSPAGLAEMSWSQRVSVLETPICDDCECRSLKRAAISVDCHNKGLTALPDVLPLNTKVLNLTSNRINSLGVPQNSKNWENVTYVYLENNLITSFQPLEINSKFMRNLAALDIRRNKFQEFPSHIFEQFINLDQVHLSNNPWLCDCESTFAFQEWLQRQYQKVGDIAEIKCGISGYDENGVRSFSLQQRLSESVIYRLSKSELCPQDNLEEPYDWLDIVNCVSLITVILMVSKLIIDTVYRYRTNRLPHFFRLDHYFQRAR